LALGGFGISRYTLDQILAQLAIDAGVVLYQSTKVFDIHFEASGFKLQTQAGDIQANMVAGCFGKRSNLDIKWNRSFIHQKSSGLDNYIGIKYHIQTQHPADLIALHNFEQGYCGISKVEGDKYCMCYLTTAAQLQAAGNDIPNMEKQVLWKNPHLKKIFNEASFIYTQPVTIAQVSFQNKTLLHEHVLMLGDAAGMITPLCGNGMSMAMHASKIAFESVLPFLKGTISRDAMEQQYTQRWQQQFEKRLQTGRIIQSLFGKPLATNLLLSSLKVFPSVTNYLIQQTHGQSF
jgi:flavin-dependent dehydrogenase